MTERTPLIDGVTVRMGGRDFVVPALTLGQLKRLDADLSALRTITVASNADDIDRTARVIHAALSRNYDCTVDEVAYELLDVNNCADVVSAVMGISGLVKRLGEMTAAETAAP